MAVAVVALFVAMGGVGYAALKLPKNSVGSKQLKANAVTSAKVKNTSLLPGDFKAGQFPAGAQGAKGLQGEQGVKGDNGGTGPRGPGTLSFDGQFARDDEFHNIATVNGIDLFIECDPPANGPTLVLSVSPVGNPNQGFHGWGTSWTGSALQHVTVRSGLLYVDGVGVADLDVVARPSAIDGRYTTFHANGIVGNGCNYHALIIPPAASVGGP